MRNLDKVYGLVDDLINLCDMHENRKVDLTDEELQSVETWMILAREILARSVIKEPSAQ